MAMGGLGNGRRGGRSPPLMIAALIACILVLGFNYWVSSSRNLELQNKVYELEGHVRRGAAERGAAEIKQNEFQGEIQRQKDQIVQIENFYKKKLEDVQSTCSQEKATMQQNISLGTKTIDELKVQLNQINDDLGKLQKELQSCKDNVETLNNKLTFDMAHCQSQVLSQKELCDDRVAKATLEIQKKKEKLVSPQAVISLDNKDKGAVPENSTIASVPEAGSHQPSISQPKLNATSELQTNDIITDRGSDISLNQQQATNVLKTASQSLPSAAAVKEVVLSENEDITKDKPEPAEDIPVKNSLSDNNKIEVMNVHEEESQIEEVDPMLESVLISQEKTDDHPVDQKPEEPDEYDAEEQEVDGVDMEKENQSMLTENIDKDMDEDPADYNGDDENEGEFEADKQAALAQI
ncbi:Golgi membrane protein 1 isoform X1 [Oryzias melastigma]|uniref:Golgi membrane protein 1 n=1 Tax=Oryzias melastigma TaxID=30732 RepID=A0A3B3E2V0_ORYME|nr:Golgi membrane protein 1 isoform X1 [Oryzias melastigma]XP_024131579.1 Golgi membrane protein 1 isoform X1 [Oryzias melastigma]